MSDVANQRGRRAMWTDKMCVDLQTCQIKAVELNDSPDCPLKPSGKKEGIMNLTVKFWNEMGYDYLGKTAQNLRDNFFVTENTIIITLLSAVRIIGKCGLESTDDLKKKQQKERKGEWSRKVMQGQPIRQTADVEDTKAWLWLQKGYLNRNREPNYRNPESGLGNKPDQNKKPKCRMCKKEGESVMHIISGYSKLVQKEYKKRRT